MTPHATDVNARYRHTHEIITIDTIEDLNDTIEITEIVRHKETASTESLRLKVTATPEVEHLKETTIEIIRRNETTSTEDVHQTEIVDTETNHRTTITTDSTTLITDNSLQVIYNGNTDPSTDRSPTRRIDRTHHDRTKMHVEIIDHNHHDVQTLELSNTSQITQETHAITDRLHPQRRRITTYFEESTATPTIIDHKD